MNKKKLLGVVAALPLLLAGCSHMQHQAGMGQNDGTVVGQHGGATTGAAGGGAELHGDDIGMTKADTAQDVVFYFGFDRSDLTDDDFASLQKHARYLITNPVAKIRIEGHTDERGSREYNVALGERRSQALARVLMLEGVPKEQVAV